MDLYLSCVNGGTTRERSCTQTWSYCETSWSSLSYILRSSYTSLTSLLQTQGLVCEESTNQSLFFIILINLHSTYNALSVVEISRRDSDNPGSSPGVNNFLVLRRVSNVLICVRCVMSTATRCVALGCVSSVIPSGSGETSPPPPNPAASSAIVASTSEGEELHADPLPHSLGEYIYDVSVFFGRKRDYT